MDAWDDFLKRTALADEENEQREVPIELSPVHRPQEHLWSYAGTVWTMHKRLSGHPRVFFAAYHTSVSWWELSTTWTFLKIRVIPADEIPVHAQTVDGKPRHTFFFTYSHGHHGHPGFLLDRWHVWYFIGCFYITMHDPNGYGIPPTLLPRIPPAHRPLNI